MSDGLFIYYGKNLNPPLACLDFSIIQAEVNLVMCLCCHGIRFLRTLRTVLFLRRELKDKENIIHPLERGIKGDLKFPLPFREGEG